jgi:beta-phosphoglucomutase family hydrolase
MLLMTALKALIFDLDGVLADTMPAHEAAWQQVAQAAGRPPLTIAELRHTYGRRSTDNVRMIAGRELLQDELDRLLAVKKAHYVAFLDSAGAEIILPGVVRLLESALDRGLKLAVASSSNHAHAVLACTGLRDYFSAVADGPTVSRPKPAPDVFVWAAGALHVRPCEAVVFEDSDAGIIAAREAGMRVVGIGEHLASDDLDWHVNGLGHFDLDALADRLGAR